MSKNVKAKHKVSKRVLNQEIYALYKGDTILDVGTKDELRVRQDASLCSLYQWTKNADEIIRKNKKYIVSVSDLENEEREASMFSKLDRAMYRVDELINLINQIIETKQELSDNQIRTTLQLVRRRLFYINTLFDKTSKKTGGQNEKQ